MEQGDKVHYAPSHGNKENGIIKEIRGEIAFVVYKCNGEWDNYMNYTGQATDLQDLIPGWINDKTTPPPTAK